jgi:hypothetical protein
MDDTGSLVGFDPAVLYTNSIGSICQFERPRISHLFIKTRQDKTRQESNNYDRVAFIMS